MHVYSNVEVNVSGIKISLLKDSDELNLFLCYLRSTERPI